MNRKSIVTPATYTHDAARSTYTAGALTFTYDPDDAKSRHEAHQAAVDEMLRLNGGADPLLAKLRARKAQFAQQAWQSEGQRPLWTEAK